MSSEENNAHELSILSPNELLKKVVTDLYFGNGKPALTLRVAGIEDELTVLKQALDKQEKWQQKMNNLLIGTLISSVGGLLLVVIEMLRHH